MRQPRKMVIEARRTGHRRLGSGRPMTSIAGVSVPVRAISIAQRGTRMSDAEQLSALIGSIYDTAIQPEKWPDALAGITKYMNGKASLLGLHNAAVRTADVFYSWGDDPKYREAYFTQYAKLNPTVVPLSLQIKPGEVFSVSTLIPYNEFAVRGCMSDRSNHKTTAMPPMY